jgi:hypothetical protein
MKKMIDLILSAGAGLAAGVGGAVGRRVGLGMGVRAGDGLAVAVTPLIGGMGVCGSCVAAGRLVGVVVEFVPPAQLVASAAPAARVHLRNARRDSPRAPVVKPFHFAMSHP